MLMLIKFSLLDGSGSHLFGFLTQPAKMVFVTGMAAGGIRGYAHEMEAVVSEPFGGEP
jgi:hypothetical protein